MPSPIINQYGVDEIDEVARDVLQALGDLDLPTPLCILGLCRVITIIGSQHDLDNACRFIDELSEIDYIDPGYADLDEDDDEE